MCFTIKFSFKSIYSLISWLESNLEKETRRGGDKKGLERFRLELKINEGVGSKKKNEKKKYGCWEGC